jgi:hypothetical protein
MRYAFDKSRGPLTSILSPELGARKKSKISFAPLGKSVPFARYSVSSFEAVDDAEAHTLHLSLSQRERIKVRDSRRFDLQEPSKLPVKLHSGSPAHRDCRISEHEFLGARGNDHVVDHVLVLKGRCALRRRARWSIAFSDNKNRGCSYRPDVVGGTCSRQSSDFENGARERVRMAWSFSEDNERDSLGGEPSSGAKFEESGSYFQQYFLPPHLNPLPRLGVEGCASGSMRSSVHYGVSL